ncbi:MAG: signal peptidase I [Anaerolineales bacterium]|nr:signal peptidase I [Anaerolineales bacterium]
MNENPLSGEAIPTQTDGSRLRAIVTEVLQTIVLAGVFYFVISLLTARVVVEGPSMRPTLLSGEWIVVNRLTYRIGSPQRGDVIVFLPPTNAQTDDLIKRVIGLPGETVGIRDGLVWINGAPLEEAYVSGTTYPDNEWQLGENALFVMGDNRPISLDSRSFGPINLSEVVGKAWLIYWPPGEWGPLEWRVGAEVRDTSPAESSFRYNEPRRYAACGWLFLPRGACEDWIIS